MATKKEVAKRLRALDAKKAQERPLESLSDLNPEQAAFVKACFVNAFICVMCSRRAGKTTGICIALLTLAKTKKCGSIFIGLTAKAVYRTVWLKIWLPLIQQYAPDARNIDGSQLTVFANGSTVQFMGSDDLKFIETQLGDSITGMAVIDEAQSQGDEILSALIDRILPPALSDDTGEGSGVLVVSGTIPEAPVGLFWNLWKQDSSYAKFKWNRFSNGYLKNQDKKLAEFLKARPALNRQSPVIARDWFAEEVFDPAARAWSGFVDALYPDGNLYEGDHPPVEFTSFAADPGGQDEFSIEGVGWNRNSDFLWHIPGYTTGEGEKRPWSFMGQHITRLTNTYRPLAWVYDSNSDNTMDLLRSDFGVIVMKRAEKGSKKAQVDRMNDLLAQRKFLIKKGSVLHRDMLNATFVASSIADGTYEWSSKYHGNSHDAARYAAAKFFEIRKKVAPKLSEAEQEAAALAKLLSQKKPSNQNAPSAMEVAAGKGSGLAATLGVSRPLRPLKNPYGL